MQVPRKRVVAATVTQSENVFLLRDRVSNQLQQQRRKKDRIQLHRQRENRAVERKQICDRNSISTSEKESSRNSEEPTESEAHCHVPHRTRSSEHSGLLLSSEKELPSDSEVVSIGSIEEDFNYSINRFCNYEPESSTCRI